MTETLYKRANNGEPLKWSIGYNSYSDEHLVIRNGLYCGHMHTQTVRVTMATIEKEFASRVNAKRKEGYRRLEELYDNAPNNLAGDDLYDYLKKYLPKYNANANGQSLAMLAKTLKDNKPFEKYGGLRGQWKINGERCLVSAVKENDLFGEIHLKFHSRNGNEWKLPYLEAYLLDILKSNILDMMIEEGAKLDGEIYLPGFKINDINHFIKNPSAPQHKLLQFWCYDIAVENVFYINRRLELVCGFGNYLLKDINKIEDHLNNKKQFVLLPEVEIFHYDQSVKARDKFIDLGFEGLILRNPKEEYAFGSRKEGFMYKFKKIEDGIFDIVDIVPEGDKRSELCKFVLRNDINDELFECTYNAAHSYQKYILDNSEAYKKYRVRVQYRERSGVKQVPFHAKAVELIEQKQWY